jgi:Kef-type K+ transport system membrane component KefB
MPEYEFLLQIGLILTIGVIGSNVLKKVNFPEILGFLLVGVFLNLFFIISGHEINLTELLDIVVAVTLGFIGFNLGSEIDWNTIKNLSTNIIIILLFESLLTFIAVTVVVYALSFPLHVALVFGALASATAPAGTAAIFWENHCIGPLTTATMFILALDDIVAIILTDLAMDYSTIVYSGHALNLTELLLPIVFDLSASFMLGITAGLLIVYALNRVEDHGRYVSLVVGSILMCIGVASILNISYILPTMIFGITVSSLCKKPDIDYPTKKALREVLGLSSPKLMEIIYNKKKNRKFKTEPHQIFHEVFRISTPIIALFFILIGISLDLTSLFDIGLIGIVYMLTRTLAKSGGAYFGGIVAKAQPVVQKYLGLCLLSQAGVALGLAVIISEHFAQFGTEAGTLGIFILNTITASTIIFQIFGPVAIKWAIDKSGEGNGQSC